MQKERASLGASKLRSKMLHLAGMPVQDIFGSLTEPVVPRGQAAFDDNEKAVKMLDDHFAYKPNTAFERQNVSACRRNSGSVCSSSAGASGAVCVHRRECPAITYMAMGFRPRSFPVGGMYVKGVVRLTKVKKNHSLLFSIAS